MTAFEQQTAKAKAVIFRKKPLGDLRVVDSFTDFPGHELGDERIGPLVCQYIE